jgi:aromatic ring-cleaving dioxygenase
MSEQKSGKIKSYHAHVYYDAASKKAAAYVRLGLEEKFDAVYGRWHDKPVGPHPRWSYQVEFKAKVFDKLIPWLALNRRDLTIFVHPNTGKAIPDHTDHAMWLGPSVDLNVDALR